MDWLTFGITMVLGLMALLAIVGLVWQNLLPMWRNRVQFRVVRHGVLAEATVLDQMVVSTTAVPAQGAFNADILYHGSFVLEVRRPGQEAYRASCKQTLPSAFWSLTREGTVVPVRVDRDDPQLVFIDKAGILSRGEVMADVERAAHEKRQAELLGEERS